MKYIAPIQVRDPDLWLEINAFECPHGLGRISPEQCQSNRNRPESNEVWGKVVALRPFPCMTCSEWKELCNLVYERRRNFSNQNFEKTKRSKEMTPKGICLFCGREKAKYARGLCSSCYRKLYDRKTKPSILIFKHFVLNSLRDLDDIDDKFLDKIILFCELTKKLKSSLTEVSYAEASSLTKDRNKAFEFIERIAGSDFNKIENLLDQEDIKRKLWFMIIEMVKSFEKKIAKEKLEEYKRLKEKLLKLERELMQRRIEFEK